MNRVIGSAHWMSSAKEDEFADRVLAKVAQWMDEYDAEAGAKGVRP